MSSASNARPSSSGWCYEEQGQVRGPFSDEQIDSMLATGKLPGFTMVWRDDGPRVMASLARKFYNDVANARVSQGAGEEAVGGNPPSGQATVQQPPPPPDAAVMVATASSATSNAQDVPTVVRVYGMIIMVESLICMALIAIQVLLLAAGGPFVLVVGAIGIGVCVVFFRLGSGLRTGQRQAVYGICLLGALSAMGMLYCWSSGQAGDRVVAGLITFVVWHVPPIVSAFRHWKAFG